MSRLQAGDDIAGEQGMQDPPRGPHLYRISVARFVILVLMLWTTKDLECDLIVEVGCVLPLCHRHVRWVEPHGLGKGIIGQHSSLTSQHELHIWPTLLAGRDYVGEHGVELHAEFVVNELANREQQAPLGVTDDP
ncbi:unnamed protein product [Linum trigynum]|uniref:Secreted protein n=1 Tax=Linum trigynum TaxID=586398 RepID=A0AAV2CFA5_9ROSI